ncbi:phage replisome organizer N-terminal domain-containing protein, partial [Clostridium beijerinckii]
MSDNKKYYYMRLKEDFFDSDEIKIIESQPNGYMYSNILLKLYLKSLKRNGKLMVTDFIPYTLESLSKVLGHNIDTVRNAIAIFKEFRLIEELSNGAIFMTEIQNFIGQSTTEADRKREYRLKIDEEKKKLNQRQMSQIEGQKSQKSNGEIVE